jgi:Ca2+-binding RTX toxin-like protein
MPGRTFVWLSTGGGAWSVAANWDDVTDNIDPSQLVPGVQDSVTVEGPGGGAMETITGPADVAAALFEGNSQLAGSFAVGSLTVGASAGGGLLALAAGTTLQAGAASLVSGSMLVNGSASALDVSGTLSMGSAQTGAAVILDVTDGGHANVLGLLMAEAAASIYVDPASVLEIGTLGMGVAGTLTIDAGAVLSGQGDANEFGAVANDGTILATGGTLALGTLTGTGTLDIGQEATLLLNGACGAGQTIAFQGANGTLDIKAEYFAPAGTLSGFAPGDAIDFSLSLISSASYTATGADGGILTLFYGTEVAARLILSGNYTGSVFLTSGDGAGGTIIGVAPASNGGGGPSPGTATPDLYAWVAPGSGAWNLATNWQDQTSGADPAAIAPGALDIVAIAAAQGSFSVISGPANAASLAITGELALSGAYGIGTLDIGQAAGANFTNGTLDLLPGTSIGAQSAAIAAGAISVAGSGAVLSVAGTLVLGGGLPGVGLPVTALTATAGGRIELGALVMGGGSGDSITTDPTGAVEIGTLGGAVAGAVTIDQGAALSGNGRVNPFGSVIDNGSIIASGGVLTLGSVSGDGVLSIASNAGLDLTDATSVPIDFLSASSTLGFAGASSAPTGTLSGVVPGDVIDLLGSPLTEAVFLSDGTSGGTLALVYGTTVVARLTLSGDFTKDRFSILSDGEGGAAIVVAHVTGGTGGGGQAGTDQLAWTGAINGNWSRAANWNDVTTGTIATLPPGAQTQATMAGPTGSAFQSVTGTGICASLGMTGNTELSGVFSIGTLSIGTAATGGAGAMAGSLVTSVHTTLTIGTVAIGDGGLVVEGNQALVTVAGTLALGDGGAPAMLDALGLGVVSLGGLALGGGDVSVDGVSSIEIGTLGGAAVGRLTIDAGFAVSGYGTLDAAGTLTDNGVIAVSGGTLLVGSVSGAGSITIGTEAALALSGAETCPILFDGAGATLILPGTDDLPGAILSGFVPGDGIVTSQSPVDSVTYAPGEGGIGTLTLWDAGAIAGTLLLAGNYAGDSFYVQPDGAGALIAVSVAVSGGGGPPAGTVTPDQYVWTGADGVLWADVRDWIDTTQGQNPAAVAPGQNDFVTITAPAGSVQAVTGPADAAGLTIYGTVALGGVFGIGTLAVGGTGAAGMLAYAAGDTIEAAAATVIGGIAGQGGTLSVAGTLVLGEGGGAGGVVACTGAAVLQAQAVLLLGEGSGLGTDATGLIEIGGTGHGAAGSVTIDPAGEVAGGGRVNLAGNTVDDGLVEAIGTLAIGNVTGTGTLLVGLGAVLVLDGSASGGLTVDFAGAGTLAIGGVAGFGASIENFGPSDALYLPVGGATQAVYALTGADTGLVTVFAGSQIVAELNFLGDFGGEVFSVAGAPGGGTILTAALANTEGGGPTMPSSQGTQGMQGITTADLLAIAPYADTYVSVLVTQNANEANYEWYMDGSTSVVGATGSSGLYVEVVGPLNSTNFLGPHNILVLTQGYRALIAQGNEAINLFDLTNGNALLVGNAGSDFLVAACNNDTMVGGPGGSTEFYATLSAGAAIGSGPNVYIQGGGNDTIVTTNDNAVVTTAGGYSSEVFLGSAYNTVTSLGHDWIICGGSNNPSDTVSAPGGASDTVFGPPTGEVVYFGGSAGATVVGEGGQIVMHGGSGNDNQLWAANSNAVYYGGTGSGAVIGGDQPLFVQGGTGIMSVWGGTGSTTITGAAGASAYVVGEGPSSVAAASGNRVWIVGPAAVSVAGAPGVIAYGGLGTGNNIFQANAGPETLWGGAGNDIFFAGTGNATLVSGGGNDVFNFTDGLAGGADEIVGFVKGADTIALHGYGPALPNVSVSGGSSFFTLQDGTHVMVVGVANLTPSCFSQS